MPISDIFKQTPMQVPDSYKKMTLKLLFNMYLDVKELQTRQVSLLHCEIFSLKRQCLTKAFGCSMGFNN